MSLVEGSIVIEAPAPGLFALSQDYTLRSAWDPFVRKMRFLGGATAAGQGVRVWVRAWTGLMMEVVFTSFRPPLSVAMKMLRGPWFLAQFAGTWLFKPLQNGSTEVIFRYSFTVRGPWPRFLVEPIIAWVFQRDGKKGWEIDRGRFKAEVGNQVSELLTWGPHKMSGSSGSTAYRRRRLVPGKHTPRLSYSSHNRRNTSVRWGDDCRASVIRNSPSPTSKRPLL